MRLVDAEAFATEMKRRQDVAGKWLREAKDHETATRADAVLSFIYEIKLTLDKMPTVDAVPVVRCKECKHFVISEGVCALLSNNYEPPVYCGDEDFCSWGRRKERKGAGK